MNTFRRLSLICVCLISFSAFAYKVQPMVAEMAPIGKGSQMSMRIDNTSNQPLTVELFPLSMVMDEFGNETTSPAEDDLLVIPVTAIIQPGRSQSVMVRYLGEPSITQSKTYRISVKQVQVKNAEKDAASLGILLQFNTLLNVRPKNTYSELSVQNIEKKDGKWMIEVANDGESYGRLTNTNWTVSDQSHSVFLKGTDVSQRIAGTLVLPKSKRIFVMDPLDGFDANSLSIEIVDTE
ncbi:MULTISPECIES: fimbrial biogenesis chaperone [Vibrio]|uniref:Molecular chaperone n=1 Tax=Vibrio cortegadensis TaxID=1328770 RepID=A0ABV4M2Y3_9VIBR|nr:MULTISPECIES: fimbria/pilus periplasmic chaperone [Vibrio]MDN3697135.1 fimbria/pilus periplasmic chaperone [Vibrio cortegadensis]TKF21674.1 molecular chaperone [Vibrio genomosp. F6]